jgi:beta-N-acetylhexosaminidase
MSAFNSEILRNAHAVLLPAISDLSIEPQLGEFLGGGGQAILLGETREEYLARKMSPRRRAEESRDGLSELLRAIRDRYGPLIVALDQELGGIKRLEGLVPDLPSAEEASRLSDQAIEDRAFACAAAANAIGVTMFLAPILDVLTVSNPWLEGRALGPNRDEVGRIGAAYIRGVQKGGVVAVAKHFPGYSDLGGDPAITDVALELDEATVWERAAPFAKAIEAGVKAVMMGPARVKALDEHNGVLASPTAIRALKRKFNFSGVVVTDDIDAPATLRGGSLDDIAVKALAAGADLLLLANGDHLPELCAKIAEAVRNGRLSVERLLEAASRIRSMAASHPGAGTRRPSGA